MLYRKYLENLDKVAEEVQPPQQPKMSLTQKAGLTVAGLSAVGAGASVAKAAKPKVLQGATAAKKGVSSLYRKFKS